MASSNFYCITVYYIFSPIAMPPVVQNVTLTILDDPVQVNVSWNSISGTFDYPNQNLSTEIINKNKKTDHTHI